MVNCGATSENCCTSCEVAGGTYYRTYDGDGTGATDGGVLLTADGGPTGLADPATVSSFRLDMYEVTVGRFRQFAKAVLPPDGGTGWRPPAGSGKHAHLNGGLGLVNASGGGLVYETGWRASDDGNISPTTSNLTTGAACMGAATWTSVAGSQENLPINCVNWYEAYAFCIWDGGFLPSEAEWEYAAAGGSQEMQYPWGSTLPGTRNQYAIYNCNYPDGSGNCTGLSNIAPVGTPTLGAGAWGQLDLAGNVLEWALDGYGSYVAPCTDCAYLATDSERIARGGGFYYASSYLVPSYRYSRTQALRDNELGFRCARAP
jgi:formylglycine-generating enzyme required for sulfatase activity